MTIGEVVRLVIQRLENLDADYLVVGAFAYFAYGIPRATNDGDFVVATSPATLDRLLAALPPEFEIDPQARLELFTSTTRWVVRLAHSPLTVEFFLLGSDAHHQEEFRRRRRLWLARAGIEAWVATAEDLVVQKIRWARRKDLDDAQNILAVQGQAIDYPYIERWCTQHGTLERLRELRAAIPPGL